MKTKYRMWDKKLNKMWPAIEFEELLRYLIFQPSPNSDAYCALKDHFDDMDFKQFTGLLDKKGVEIYEGDICKGEDTDSRPPDHEFTGPVIFSGGTWAIKGRGQSKVTIWLPFWTFSGTCEVEVIPSSPGSQEVE